MDIAHPNQRLLSSLQAEISACRRCRKAGLLTLGRPICSGPATARLMVVGQAPSRSDHIAGRLWSGPAGRRLMAWLAATGLDEEMLRREQYLTAVTRCYPGPARSGHGDRTPSAQEVRLCRDYIDAELGLLDVQLIIPAGRLAIDSFGGNGRPLDTLIGRAFQANGTWIVPLPHPSGASLWLNRAENRGLLARALAIIRQLCRELEIP